MNYTFGFIGVGNMGGALAAAAKKGNGKRFRLYGKRFRLYGK